MIRHSTPLGRSARSLLAFALTGGFLFAIAAPASAAACAWAVVNDKSDGIGTNLLGVSASAATDVWSAGVVNRAAGQIPIAEHWNGKTWALYKPAFPNSTAQFSAVADVSPSLAYFAGYSISGETEFPLIESWDGKAFTAATITPPKTQLTQLNGIASVSATDRWAAGSTAAPGQPSSTYVLFNGGNKWVRAVSPNVSGGANALTAFSVISENYVWAVGTVATGPASFPVYTTLSEFWNGKKWIVVHSLNVQGAESTLLESVKVIAKNDVWAVGFSISQGTGYAPLAEHFNGAGWQIYTTPNVANSSLYSVSASSTGDVFAVGQSVSSAYQTLTEHWNGAAWSVVSSPNESGGHGDFLSGVTYVPGTTDYWSVGATINANSQYAAALSEEYTCGANDAMRSLLRRPPVRG